MNAKSRFIVLEGLDGTGKSTQIDLLQNYLNKHSVPNHFVHFPRTNHQSPVYGNMIASFLRGDYGPIENVHPELVALIYAGDRFNASNELKNVLKSGTHIIADRYVFSNIAYQCAKLKNTEERTNLMNFIFEMEYEYFGIPEPDISVFLHVPFSFVEKQLNAQRMSEDRVYLKGKDDIHEKDFSFQKAVEEIYLHVCNTMPEKLHYMSCLDNDGLMMKPDDIHTQLLKLLKNKNFIL
ncbi:MAG: dTMP kinase [Bacteroidales bacterium]|nr:dTMP kinase [Bacteroidales bacterium]